MNWRDVYSSKRRFLRTIGKYYLLSAIVLLATLSMFDDYKKSGGIVIRRGVPVIGNQALGFIVALFFVCLIAFIYASFIGLYGLRYYKSASATKWNLTPEYWICIKCNTTFPGYSVNNHCCPQCSGNLEDLNGYYERHPELRYQVKTSENNQSNRNFIRFTVVWTIVWVILLFLIYLYLGNSIVGLFVFLGPFVLCAFLVPIFFSQSKIKR